MTITCQPMDASAGSPQYTAQNERQALAALLGAGSGRPLGARSGFRADTAAGVLSVTSTAWTLQPCAAVIDPGAGLYQGAYRWASDGVLTGAITAADSTNTRLDILYIQVNDSSAGDGSGALTAPVTYLAGTASATPAAPALPARSLLVGTITVPKAGAGSPSVVLNPARFVTAGGILPVASQAEEDALKPYAYPGMAVARTDFKSALRVFDGSSFDNSINPAADSGWTLTGHVVSRATISGRQATAGFSASYTGGAVPLSNSFTGVFTITNLGAFKPFVQVFGTATLYTSAYVPVAGIEYNINPSGVVSVRLSSLSSASIPSGGYIYINAVWPL